NALTDSMQRVDMMMIDDIGATSVRFAHYQQADIIYSLCDSLGILAWAEIPFVNASSGKEGPNAKQQLTELIKQNYNHPSIFTWGLHNEVYTKYPSGYPARLTHELNDLAKVLDPYRPTVSTSGYGTMDRNMNRKADIQAMNRYFGWYYGDLQDLDTWIDGLKENYPEYNVVLSEYGAGANIHQHTEDVRKPKNVISGQFFPEEYQTQYHVYYWSVIEAHPYLLSSYVWNMFDFCVPGGWNRGGVMDRNLKGLITFDRQTKKDAFFWYKANWSEHPVLHIAGRRFKNRTKRENRIEVFSNLENLELSLNGKDQGAFSKGANECDLIWNLKLKKGENRLKATGTKNGKTYTDTIVLYYKK
ncbi:MAG TPA: glycoside hydrolase family 2 TIM barrel-domain containing protein, partial [Chitinophagaceae bacterium]|nr:glycoside hydrolase family 2 TIM barrel-domain containing protein [Chitinophagaceae bacterium]